MFISRLALNYNVNKLIYLYLLMSKARLSSLGEGKEGFWWRKVGFGLGKG